MEGNPPRKFIDGIYAKDRDFSQKPRIKFSQIWPSFCWGILLIILIFSGLKLYFASDNLKSKIQVLAFEGQEHLELAKDALTKHNFPESTLEFQKAQNNFHQANLVLAKAGQDSAYLRNFYKSENMVVEGEKLLYNIEEISNLGGQTLTDINSFFDSENNQNIDFLAKINNCVNSLVKIEKLLQQTQNQTQDQNLLNPKISNEIDTAINSLNKVNLAMTKLPEILGSENLKNYLILFQNPAEIRPTGGFIGNYGEIKFTSGKIQEMKVGDVYTLKHENLGGKEPKNVMADVPLKFVRGDLPFWEGNWHINFPTSAEKMEWLYTKYGEMDPEGVIAVDPKIFEDILKITGSVKMPEYDVVLNEENFRELIQYKIEVDNPFKRGESRETPKKILQDFTPLFIEKIKNSSAAQKIQIFESIFANLNQKHLLLYTDNQEFQNFLSQMGWSGEIKAAPKDFLMVADSNISGTKSSFKLKEDLSLKVNILSDGTIINKVNIVHNAENLEGLLADRDLSFVQVVVPENSELIEAVYNDQIIPKKQIKIFQESGKTIFAWGGFEVYPNEIKNLSFEYKLPFNISENNQDYSLIIQKQPGTMAVGLKINFDLANNLNVANFSPQDLKSQDHNLEFLGNLEQDRYLGINFRQGDSNNYSEN